MTKPESNKIDFNTNNRLSVQVSLTGLSFFIYDTAAAPIYTKEIDFSESLSPEEVLNEIKSAFSQNDELQVSFNEVTIIHENKLYSLVPKALFKESHLEDYLALNTKLFPTDFIAFDTHDAFDFVVVYVPLTNVNNYFFDTFGSFTYLHSTTVFIKQTLLEMGNSRSQKMFVKLYKDQMDVMVTSGKKLQLFNSFTYTTPEDFIYYILFVAEQLQLNLETIPLELCGHISEDDEFFEIAYTYIRNVTCKKENNSNSLYIS